MDGRQLLSENAFEQAQRLFAKRKEHLKRLAIARGDTAHGCLGVTLQGTYQEEDFVDAIRPHVVALVLEQIAVVDESLRVLGFAASAVPGYQLPESQQ